MKSAADNRFSCRDGGIWFDELQRLSDEFCVVGQARNAAGEPHYIISHHNNYFALPWSDLGERSGWRIMRQHIRRLPISRRNQERLIEYIQLQPLAETWQITDTAGWAGNAYILPNGDILGERHRTFFCRPIPHPEAFHQSGTLQEWQLNIGQYLACNSRLCLFAGAAFAAPLLRIFGIDGGVLHVFGESSSGKSTAQRVGLSVWGHGKDAGHSWNATGYALTNAAAARNDGLLSLDEIGEDTQGAVQTCAYTIANGRARLQGAKSGGNRPDLRFRVLAISSGETTLATHLGKQGRQVMAGQLVRCPSIPHILEEHHGFFDFKTFTEHLNEAVVTSYGSAGRAFIERLTFDSDRSFERAKRRFDAFLENIQQQYSLNSQIARTARLFAACAAGLILASEWAISGITAEQARQGLMRCFADWYALQPSSSIEETRALEAAENWMQQYAHSYRFSQWSDAYTKPEHAGFHRYTCDELKAQNIRNDKRLNHDELDALQEYWIIPAVFEREICAGYETSQVCTILHRIGWLKRYEDNSEKRWKYRRYGKGRFYVLKGAQPPDPE